MSYEGESHVGYVGQKKKKKKLEFILLSRYTFPALSHGPLLHEISHSLGESLLLFTCRNKGMLT